MAKDIAPSEEPSTEGPKKSGFGYWISGQRHKDAVAAGRPASAVEIFNTLAQGAEERRLAPILTANHIELFPDRLEQYGGQNVYPFSKWTTVVLDSTQQHQKTSGGRVVGGAIVGKALGSAGAGAVVGAVAKKETTTGGIVHVKDPGWELDIAVPFGNGGGEDLVATLQRKISANAAAQGG